MIQMTQKEFLNLNLRVKRGVERKAQRGDSKYRNIVVDTEQGKFDSKAEHRHYLYLAGQEAQGKITDLRRQVTYVLCEGAVVAGRKRPAIRYVADFVYFDVAKNMEVCADVKGVVTPEYRIKRHLMKVIHGIDIVEVRA